jgi:hypothetical protein
MLSPTAAAALSVSKMQKRKSAAITAFFAKFIPFVTYSLIFITQLIILLEVKKYTGVISMFERFAELAREKLCLLITANETLFRQILAIRTHTDPDLE